MFSQLSSLDASIWALFILLFCVAAVSMGGWVAMTKLVTMIRVWLRHAHHGYPQPWIAARTCLSKAQLGSPRHASLQSTM